MNREKNRACAANSDLHPIQISFNLQDVHQTSPMPRRLYRMILETMRAMSGRISSGGLGSEEDALPVIWFWSFHPLYVQNH
jgi:hypothetical protein